MCGRFRLVLAQAVLTAVFVSATAVTHAQGSASTSSSPFHDRGEDAQSVDQDSSIGNTQQDGAQGGAVLGGSRLAQANDNSHGIDTQSTQKQKPSNSAPSVFSGAEGKLQEIVVTAQRRLEKLQDVPISAQVIDSQTLAEQNHNTLDELTRTVPAVHISTGYFSNALFIRGVGSGDNASFDQSVAMFSDDIYHGRARMSDATFLDLDRIEILKGPQSTFFGNNAIAGALNIVTKKPGDHFDASARGLYGQFGQYDLEGAVGGPITDAFGVRLAVTRNGDDRGWIRNVNLGRYAPRANNLAGRVTLVFNPNEDLVATLKVEGSQSRLSGAGSDLPDQWINCPPPPPIAPSFGNSGCDQALAQGVPIGLHNNKNSGLAGQGHRLSTFEDVLTINYSRWGQTFTSVSGFYKYTFDENTASPLPIESVTTTLPETYHQFSQELRIASPTNGPIEYLAGAYFQTDKLANDAESNAPIFNSIFGATPLAPYLPIAALLHFTQPEHVYSVFGSLSWNVTDLLKISGGLRGSWVKKDTSQAEIFGTGTQVFGGFVPFPPAAVPIAVAAFGALPAGNFSRSDRAWMPSAGIHYKIAPEAMVYFTYSRGFKAGGINGQAFGAPDDIEFGPEHVNAYELGVKSKWVNDRLLLNVDVFRSDYKDLQVTAGVYHAATNSGSLEVRNAANSRSQGVEFETQWVVSREFQLSANVTYLDSYYLSYPNAGPSSLQQYCGAPSTNYSATPQCAIFPFPVPAFRDLSGRQTQYSPRWSGSVTASYGVLLPGGYKFSVELSPYFTSSYNKEPELEAIGYATGTDSYTRLDGRLTLGAADQRWAIDLIGKNLTDRIISTAPFDTLYNVSKEQPRNVAVQFRYHW